MKAIKSKYWRLEIYPTKEQLDAQGLASDYDGSSGYGSLPDNWLEILEQTCLPMAISPLHDKDLKPDGTLKKPHYHIVINYPSSNTTLKAVKDRLSDPLHAPVPFVAENPRGAYEYLWHQNSPEKFQYNKDEVIHLSGYKVPITSDEARFIKAELQNFIRDHDITEYCVFCDAVLATFAADSDQFEIACNYHNLFYQYIQSRRHSRQGGDTTTPPPIG